MEERAVGANREGLEFAHVQVSRNLSKDQVDKIIKKLWFDVLEKVTNYLEEFNRVSGRKLRVGNLVLGVPSGGRHLVARVKVGSSRPPTNHPENSWSPDCPGQRKSVGLPMENSRSVSPFVEDQ